MADVIVIKRRRNWEWQVRDQNGELILGGRERSRRAARYHGYRGLFRLLAAGHRLVDLPAVETSSSVARPAQDSPDAVQPDADGSELRFSSAQPKTDQSQ